MKQDDHGIWVGDGKTHDVCMYCVPSETRQLLMGFGVLLHYVMCDACEEKQFPLLAQDKKDRARRAATKKRRREQCEMALGIAVVVLVPAGLAWAALKCIAMFAGH